MSQDHRLQQQRFELKYLVPEAITGAIRDFVSCHLELDDYARGRPNCSYTIHSIYLDSDGLYTHHSTINGDPDRFKLRLRYYDDNPASPVFFEIKGRADNCILKKRCPVRREDVEGVLAGQLPGPDHWMSDEPRHHAALNRFVRLANRLGARPRLHNTYLREAWVSPNGHSVRVTFDRNIRVEPYFHASPVVEMARPTRIYSEWVVLELKFTTRFPDWFQQLVQRFDLMRATSAKYSGGVATVGEEHFQGRRLVPAGRILTDAPQRRASATAAINGFARRDVSVGPKLVGAGAVPARKPL